MSSLKSSKREKASDFIGIVERSIVTISKVSSDNSVKLIVAVHVSGVKVLTVKLTF